MHNIISDQNRRKRAFEISGDAECAPGFFIAVLGGVFKFDFVRSGICAYGARKIRAAENEQYVEKNLQA